MYFAVMNLTAWKKLLYFCSRLVASLLIVIVLFFTLKNVFFSDTELVNAEPDAERIIVIDAGHGGEDPGAISADGKYEKDLNLQIALELGEQLYSKGFTVVYTRTTDKMLYLPEENIKGMRKLSDLKNRCKIANQYDNAIMISIHMNSFGSSEYSGLQVYYDENNDDSRMLANCIQTSTKNNLQANNTRQIKSGKNLYLLDNSENLSVLIECGFLSNAAECKKLSQKEYQKQLSFAIVCGIIEYIGASEALQ